MTKREIAQFFGVSSVSIDNWIARGCPVAERTDDGRFKAMNLRDVVRWRYEESETGPSTLEEARTRLANEQADKAALENAETRGELVRVAAVAESWGRMISAARARLLSLPTKAGPIARAARTDAEAAELVRQEVFEALAELARDPADVDGGH